MVVLEDLVCDSVELYYVTFQVCLYFVHSFTPQGDLPRKPFILL